MKTIFLFIYFVFQSTLYQLREIVVGFGFQVSSVVYVFFKKGESWQVHTRQLLSYPNHSLGYHLGCFLLQHKFEPQPRCEDHDIFHVLTGYRIDTTQEIAMQYWLWGNGKRSLFVALAMLVGIILYIDAYETFAAAFYKGKNATAIHHIDFKQHLSSPISNFKSNLNIIKS